MEEPYTYIIFIIQLTAPGQYSQAAVSGSIRIVSDGRIVRIAEKFSLTFILRQVKVVIGDMTVAILRIFASHPDEVNAPIRIPGDHLAYTAVVLVIIIGVAYEKTLAVRNLIERLDVVSFVAPWCETGIGTGAGLEISPHKLGRTTIKSLNGCGRIYRFCRCCKQRTTDQSC